MYPFRCSLLEGHSCRLLELIPPVQARDEEYCARHPPLGLKIRSSLRHFLSCYLDYKIRYKPLKKTTACMPEYEDTVDNAYPSICIFALLLAIAPDWGDGSNGKARLASILRSIFPHVVGSILSRNFCVASRISGDCLRPAGWILASSNHIPAHRRLLPKFLQSPQAPTRSPPTAQWQANRSMHTLRVLCDAGRYCTSDRIWLPHRFSSCLHYITHTTHA